jgi:hypothetical protein
MSVDSCSPLDAGVWPSIAKEVDVRPSGPDDVVVTPPTAIWFYGADAVGKSVVGWEAYSQLVARGLPTAYIDTDYLGFCDPRPDDPSSLVAANLAAMWDNYVEHGVRHLVISGILVTPQQRSLFADTLTNCSFSTVLLQAQPATIRGRIVRRREVEAAEQQTQLSDSALRELHDYGDRSARFAELLEAGGFSDLSIRTDDATPGQIAAEALDRLLPAAA